MYKNQKIILWVGIAVLILIIILGETSQTQDDTSDSQKRSTAEPVVVIDKSTQMQNSRKEFINKLLREGVFKKVEMPASLIHVWVDTSFILLDYDTKKSFLEVVYCYYYDGNDLSDSVVLKDNLTGKRIGGYSPSSGLKIK